MSAIISNSVWSAGRVVILIAVTVEQKTAVYLRQKAEVSGAEGKEEERNGNGIGKDKYRENYF